MLLLTICVTFPDRYSSWGHFGEQDRVWKSQDPGSLVARTSQPFCTLSPDHDFAFTDLTDQLNWLRNPVEATASRELFGAIV